MQKRTRCPANLVCCAALCCAGQSAAELLAGAVAHSSPHMRDSETKHSVYCVDVPSQVQAGPACTNQLQ